MHPPRFLVALLAAWLVAADDRGGIVLPGESRPAATRLEEARKHLTNPRAGDPIALTQSVLDVAGNELVPVDGQRVVSARWMCHALLARLAPPLLQRYRKSADAQAQRWLEQARGPDDIAPLLRIVDEVFCSSVTPVALDRLGDHAFLRGRFAEAEAWWRLLAPLEPVLPANLAPDDLVYPDPTPALVARVRAKQLLARLYRGQSDWQDEFEAYRNRHPTAEGILAGQTGLYIKTLADLAERVRNNPLPESDWPTFGGNPGRSRVARPGKHLLRQLSELCRAGPSWTFDLDQRTRLDGVPPRQEEDIVPMTRSRRLAYHPVLVGHLALVADAHCVTAYDLRTGKAEDWYDLRKYVGGIQATRDPLPPLDQRYTLTVAEDHVFARLGTRTIRDVRKEARRGGAASGDAESALVCLSLTPGANGDRRRWMVRAIDPARREFAIFEGAPLVRDGRVYIAATRFESDRVVTAIHCYAAHPEDTVSPLLWRTDVCETRELLPAGGQESPRQRRSRQHLLTLAGSRLVWCSHSGALVAVDANTGRRAWGVRYPRLEGDEPEDDPSLHDLVPPVFDGEHLYIAPSDSDRLLCLDPANGSLLWKREGLDIVHLIGVGSGRLIFTTWRSPREGHLHRGGLRAVMAADGNDHGGWVLPDDGGGLLPFGRPVLVGDLVLWPTAREPFGVFAIRQVDGLQPDNPALLHRMPAGNLVWANGYLLVIDQFTLRAFVPPEAMGDEGDKAMTQADDRPERRRALVREAHREVRAGHPAGATWRWSKILALGASGEEERRARDGLAQAWQTLGCPKGAEILEASGTREPPDPLSLEGRGVRGEGVLLARTAVPPPHPQPLSPKRRGEQEEREPPLKLLANVALGPHERFLPIEKRKGTVRDHLYSGVRGALLCRSRDKGTLLWKVPAGCTPQWAVAIGTFVIAGGPEGIESIDASSGQRIWRFESPRLPLALGETSLRVAPLGRGFLLGDRLVVAQGERRLLCLDALTGKVCWQRSAPGGHFQMPPPRGRFLVVHPLGADRILAQVSARRWLLEVRTGALIDDQATPLQRWPRQPHALGDTICLVPDATRVVALDRRHGKSVWEHQLPGVTTRSGEPPVVVPAGKAICIIEPLNIGYRLRQLDRTTGKPIGSKTPLLPLPRLEPTGWLTQGETLLHAGAGRLFAWSLPEGKLLWQRPLRGEGAWRLQREGDTILAWQERAAGLCFGFRWLAGSVQWRVGPLPDGRAWSVLWLDARGNEVKRVDLMPETLPLVRSHEWLATGATAPALSLARDPSGASGPTVVQDHLGLIVAVGNRIQVLALAEASSSE